MQEHSPDAAKAPERSRSILVAGVVVLLTVPALIPFARAGYWQSHDGLIHLFRLVALRDAITWGHWYPRIFPDFAYDYGFAVLHYYAPLTYYVALVFSELGLDVTAAMKLTFALSLPFAACAMWWLARTVWRDETAGVLAAGVYTYVPYHLADVHVRGALAESWAFVWWPILLWAIWERRFVLLAVALAGLVFTHNLSAVLVVPVLALWVLTTPWIRERVERRRTIPVLVGSAVLGALLSAAYWLPVLFESQFVHLATDVGGRGFVRHLQPLTEWIATAPVYSYFPDQGVAGEHPLAWMQLVVILAAIGIGVALWRRLPARRAFLALVVVLFLSIILLTPISLSAWDTLIFPLGMVQYPWRWLGITALATGLLAGILVLPLRDVRLTWAVALVVPALLAATTLPGIPWEPVSIDPATVPETMWAMDFENQQIGATWTAEYLPRWVREERWAIPRPVERPALGEVMAPADVELVEASPWAYELRITSDDPTTLRLHQFFLPAWQVRVDGAAVRTHPASSLGLVSADVPAGEHTVTIAWERTAPVAVGTLVSIIGFVILIGILVRYHRGLLRNRGTAGLVALVLGGLIVAIVGRPAQDLSHPPRVAVNASVGEQASLLGWRFDAASYRAGTSARIILYWLNRRNTPVNYNVFLHLTDDDGIPLAQSDGAPGGGYTPTTRWVAGELVPDRHRLTVPGDVPAGEYQLWAGLYEPASGERLPVSGRSDGRVFLGRLTVH